MNEQRLQQEPSIEEILASIRRIISEDEAAYSRNRAPAGPTTPTPANSAASTLRDDAAGLRREAAREGAYYAPDKPAELAPQAVASSWEGNVADDYVDGPVLDLTEMVAEDGSVVTIAPVSAAVNVGADIDDANVAYDDHDAYDDTLKSDPAAYASHRDDIAVDDIAVDDITADDGVVDDDPPPVADPVVEAPALAEDEIAVSPATPEAVSTDTDASTPAEASKEAAAELLESPALQDMIREAVKPLLREWMDRNLSRLVEEVARQELDRMIERRGGP